MKREQNFLNIYETRIKKYRDRYYEDILNDEDDKGINPLIPYIVIIAGITLILALFKFNNISVALSVITTIFLSYAIYKNTSPALTYKSIVKLYGYSSIEDYERDLKKYVAGPTGAYYVKLQEYKDRYNIIGNEDKITLLNGDTYLVWDNKEKDTLVFLNTSTYQRPQIKKIKIEDIDYFRTEKNKTIKVKVGYKIYELRQSSLPTINKYLKNKKFEYSDKEESIVKYNQYLKNVINKVIIKKEKRDQLIIRETNAIILSIIFLILVCLISSKLNDYQVYINIIKYIVLIVFIINICKIFKYKAYQKNDIEEKEKILKHRQNVLNFQELKYNLRIPEDYDIIETIDNKEYMVWNKGKYFHLFLNDIDDEVEFIQISKSKIKYTTEKEYIELSTANEIYKIKKEYAKVLYKLISK